MQYQILGAALAASAVLIVAGASMPAQKQFDFGRVSYGHLTPLAQKQVECLAENIYFESAHEPIRGKIAVAMVTLNRVNSGLYPSTICDVVHQKTRTETVTVCQFSWVCDSRVLAQRRSVKHTKLYQDIRSLSVKIYLEHDDMEDVTRGSLNYHAVYVNPGWNLPVSVKIGQHIFYKPRKQRGDQT
jgi:spore germination cell wall hydrolase CwlJ-like protein